MLPGTLTTERLTLRAPRLDDADWIATEIARPLVHQMLTTPPCPYRVADAKAWLSAATGLSGVYAVIADVPLGVISLEPRTWGRELGYWLRVDRWGLGYMTEAARAVVGAWFAAGDVDLSSGHLTENHASAGVLRKLGFQYEAPVLRHSQYWGREVEVQRMRLTRARWLSDGRAQA